MKHKELQEYILNLTNTNRTLSSYVDWDKVKENTDKHRLNLAQLDIFTNIKNDDDIKDCISQLFKSGREDVFESLDILIAKRDSDREYFDEETNTSKDYSIDTPEDVFNFINKTNLNELFTSVKSLSDYVFGVEVGLDTNGRKNRSGKTMETLIRNILVKSNIDFKEQVHLKDILDQEIGNKKIKRVDFVFEIKGITYLIESSFYNAGGSKISEVCNSYSDFTSKLNKKKYSMIWVADGKGMKTIEKLLDEQWDNVEVMNIQDFKEFLNTKVIITKY